MSQASSLHQLLQRNVLKKTASAEAEKSVEWSLPLLVSDSELSTTWLTQALQVFDADLPAVKEFYREDFSKTAFEDISRITLRYEQECTGPVNLLCKISAPLPGPNWADFIEDVGKRETSAYQVLGYHNVCRIPPLYFSSTDHSRVNFLLGDNGSLPASRNQGNDIAQADSVLRELALLHGCFARHSPVSAPEWLLRPREYAELIAQRYDMGKNLLTAQGQGWLPAEHVSLIQAFSDCVSTWHNYEKHILTITHGDVRTENMLFDQQKKNCRATLIGWKLAGLRNPMFDVASLLSNSLTLEDRRAHEIELVDRYRKQFEQSGIDYSSSEAKKDYQFNLFAPLIFNLCAAGYLGESLFENESLIENISRNCQAIMDWDSMGLLKNGLSAKL